MPYDVSTSFKGAVYYNLNPQFAHSRKLIRNYSVIGIIKAYYSLKVIPLEKFPLISYFVFIL